MCLLRILNICPWITSTTVYLVNTLVCICYMIDMLSSFETSLFDIQLDSVYISVVYIITTYAQVRNVTNPRATKSSLSTCSGNIAHTSPQNEQQPWY